MTNLPPTSAERGAEDGAVSNEPVTGELTQLVMRPEFFDDPYPTYDRLRETSPLLKLDPPVEDFIATGYDAVYGILRDHRRFSSAGPHGDDPEHQDTIPGLEDTLRLVLITNDPPRHTRFRGLVNKAFTPRRIAELEPWITELAREFVDDIESASDGGEVDVMERLAVPLPVTVIAKLLGIPGERRDDFKRWSSALLSSRTTETQAQDVLAMVRFLGGTLLERRAQAAEDLITALSEAEIDGERLRDWEIVGFTVLLLVAGNETTTNLIGNMLNVLATRPDLWARLREDRALVEPVIEEALRYDSPVQMLNRWALEDTEVDGVRVPKGSGLLVSFGAGNRDPRAFPEPGEFRLDRGLQHHLAFGMGVHYCLGSPLARTEARLALNALLDRFERLEPGSEPGERQRNSYIVRGFNRLPLRFA